MNEQFEAALTLLNQAFASPLGIELAIGTSDFEACRQRLYRARAQSKDADLADLQIKRAPGGALWIVKGAAFETLKDEVRAEDSANSTTTLNI